MKTLHTWSMRWETIGERIGERMPGRWRWDAFGPDGIVGQTVDAPATIIVTVAEHDGFGQWLHASIARADRYPSYFDLVALHEAVWGRHGFAYQVFTSDERHVSIHDKALHLWGRADGTNVLPDFGVAGTI